MTMQMPDTRRLPSVSAAPRPPKPAYQGLFQEPDWPEPEDEDDEPAEW